MARELQYQGLAELNVLVNDISKYSSEYFQVTNFPSVFTAGKNLFRFKGIADKFIEESDILIEVLDSNGQPIYYEADLNLESGEQSIIVAVYVDEETPPGQGEIILCGYLANVISEEEGPTVRWRQPIDIDPTKQNDAEIIFNVIPAATVSTSSVVDSYTITGYANAALVNSASIRNFTYDYRNNGNPVIIGTVNTAAIASLNKSGSARFEVSRSRFTGNPSSTFTLTATTLSSSVVSYISTGSNIIFTLSDPFESGIQGSNQVHTFINGTGTTGSLYFDQTGSTSSSENTYTIISASFTNLQPQIGNIAKIRTFYKSVGVGEYVLASETDILDLATEFGYTPESASIIVPLPTVHRNDRFDLKFQFLNSAEAVSKQVLYVKDVGMPGGNVYIGGDDNLITGSVYVAGQTGTGVSIEGSTNGAFIRSVGYEGFQNVVANGATGQPGFIMYSGSVTSMLNSTQTENYRGIGLELTAHSESYLRYTTSGSGLLDIRTNKFFLGSSQQYIVGADGLIEISSSNFFLSSSGDVIMAGTITATAGNIGGFTITSHSLSGNNFFISGAASPTGFFISASRFNVKGNGDITGSNVLFTGGKIGSFTLTNDAFTAGSTFFISSSVGGTPATAFFISSSRFNVRQDGTVSGSNVFFNGGRIGSFTLSNDSFAAGSTFFISSSVGGTPASAFFISSSRFNVRQDGTISGSNVFFNGGRIGSFTLSNDAFTAGSTFFISSSVSGTPTTAFFISSSRFNVKQDGTVTGSSALFSGSVSVVGTINALAGNIGGFAITDNAITGSGFYLSGSATGTGFFISSSRFNVKGNGDVTGSNVLFTGGRIGSFALSTNALSGINSNTGATTFFISSSVDTTSPDGVAFFMSSSKFNVRQDGTISGSQVFFDGGKVGGFTIDSSKITGTNIIIDSAGSLQTADYASDLKGWKISAVDNGFAEFENVKVRGTLKTAVFEKETVNAVGGQLYVANSSTISGSEASSSIPQLAYLKFGGYSGSNAIQNIAGSSNTYLTLDLTSASIANLPTSTQTFKPLGGTGLLIVSGAKAASSSTNTNIATLPGITTTVSASYTVMAWVRPNFSTYTSSTPTGSIIEKSGSSGVSTIGPFFIGFKVDKVDTGSVIYSSGNEVSIGGSVQTGSLATGSLRSNQWTHIALTGTGSGTSFRRILYVNGAAQTAVDTATWPNTNTSPINLGVGRTYTDRFPGYITDFRLYTGSLSADQIAVIYSGSYVTASIDASTTALQIDNVTGFVNGEILSAKKVSNTGFATEYFQVRDTMRLNPSSDTDFSGMLYVTRSYGNGLSGNSGSLGNSPSTAQSYEPSQVIVSTGKLGTGFIRINANPNDQATPYIDIVERTGSGIYDVALKARLGDLSGLANSSYVFGNSNPGFGLATDNVFLQGGIIANTGSIGGIQMQNNKLFTGTGTFNNNNTGFYLDASSNFSLGNKFSWNGSTLSVSGTLNAVDGNIGGFAITNNAITGSGFYLSGSATATGFFISSSKFNIKGNGDVTGSNVLFTGGTIGGFTIGASSLTATNFAVNSTAGEIELGSATTFALGDGIYMSKDSTNNFRVGDQGGARMQFTGDNLEIYNSGNTRLVSIGASNTIAGFTLSDSTLSNSTNFFISGSATGDQFFISASNFNVKANGNVTGSQVLFTGGRIGSFALTNDALTAGSTFFISSSVGGTPASAFFISSSRFNVRQDGTVSGSNVFFNGGSIGSFTLSNEALTAGSTFFISSSIGGTPASAFFISSSRFNVRQDGTVSGSNVFFNGGTIAGFTLSGNSLSNGNNFFISGSATGNQFFISASDFNVKANGQITGSDVLFDGGTVGGFNLTTNRIYSTNVLTGTAIPRVELNASAGAISGSEVLLRRRVSTTTYTLLDTLNGFADFSNIGRQVVADNNVYTRHNIADDGTSYFELSPSASWVFNVLPGETDLEVSFNQLSWASGTSGLTRAFVRFELYYLANANTGSGAGSAFYDTWTLDTTSTAPQLDVTFNSTSSQWIMPAVSEAADESRNFDISSDNYQGKIAKLVAKGRIDRLSGDPNGWLSVKNICAYTGRSYAVLVKNSLKVSPTGESK